MTKEEVIEFLHEQKRSIEDVLYQLDGTEPKVDGETLNHHIQARFRDALMFLNHGKHDELKGLLERAAENKWV